MRSNGLVTASICALLIACSGWKSGQANSAQANISNDDRPPATANASAIPSGSSGNDMVMLTLPSVKGAEAVRILHARQDGMKALGDATKAIHRALTGTPDLPTVRSKAATVASLAQQAAGWFPLGTGPEAGKTGAKPDIWTHGQDFAAKLHNLQNAARAFNAAASQNDIAAMNARFADLGGTCKSCHDQYRLEEHH